MAKITFPGLTEYEQQISRLGQNAQQMAGKAIYAGAEIIADAIRANIQRISASSDRTGLYAYAKQDPPPLTESAKKGLLDGLGIAPLQDDNGYMNVKVGFDGYNDLRTEKYPKGQPNVMIARSLESGSSIAPKRPFVRPAVTNSRKLAEAKMAEVLDAEMKKIME